MALRALCALAALAALGRPAVGTTLDQEPGCSAAGGFTLGNGLQVVVQEDQRAPLLYAELCYRTGAKDDPIGRAGLAHLVEHLSFRRTRHLEEGQAHRLFHGAGATDVGATTGWEETRYRVALPVSALELVFWVYSSQMGFFLDRPGAARAITPERKVVLQELAGASEDLDRGLRELVLARLLYPAGHPYARAIAGNRTELGRATVDDARAFQARHYRPDNAVLTVVGAVDRARVRQLAERYFGPVPARQPPPPPVIPPVVPGRRRATIEAPVEAPALLMAWPVPPLSAEQAAGARVIAELLPTRIVLMGAGAPLVKAEYRRRQLGDELVVAVELDSRSTMAGAEHAVDGAIAQMVRQALPASDLEGPASRMATLRHTMALPGGESTTAAATEPKLTPALVQATARVLFRGDPAIVETLPRRTAPRAGRLVQPLPLWDRDAGLVPAPAPVATPDAAFRHHLPDSAPVAPVPATVGAVLPSLTLPSGLTVVQTGQPGDRSAGPVTLAFRTSDGSGSAADRAATRVLAQMLWQRDRPPSAESTFFDKSVFVQRCDQVGLICWQLLTAGQALDAALPKLGRLATEPLLDEAHLRQAKDTLAARLRGPPLPAPESARVMLATVLRGEPQEVTARLTWLEAVSLREVQNLYRRFVHPKNGVLLTSGRPASMEQLGAVFGRWLAPSGARPAIWAGPAPLQGGAFTVVDRPDLSRAEVVFTFPIPGGASPDGPAVALLTRVLAGGLDSRLGALRNRTGWLYAISQLLAQGHHSGRLAVIVEVPPDRVAALVAGIRHEIEGLANTTMRPDELGQLREGQARALSVALGFSEESAGLALASWLSGVPLAELPKQAGRLRTTDALAVQRAARKYLAPGRAHVLVVGPSQPMAAGLRALGPLTIVPPSALPGP